MMVEVKVITVNNTVTLRIKAVLTFDPVGDKMQNATAVLAGRSAECKGHGSDPER